MRLFLRLLLAALIIPSPSLGLARPAHQFSSVSFGAQQTQQLPIEELLPAETIALIVTPQLSTLLTSFRQLEAFNLLDTQTRLMESSRQSSSEGRRDQTNAPGETLRFLSFGIRDRKVLDQSRVGFALLKPPPAAPQTGQPGATKAVVQFQEPFFAAFIESPTPELAREARKEFLAYFSETFEDLGDLERPKTTASRVENFRSGYAGAMLGLTYVLGDAAAINAILKLSASRDEPRLSDDPDFLRARAQLGGVGRVFGYLSGTAWSHYVAENLGERAGASNETFGPLIEEPVKSVALASEFTADGVIDRALVSFDPSKRSIFSTLVSGSAISSKTPNYLPAGTGIMVSASLDPARFYDEMFGPFMVTTFGAHNNRTGLTSTPRDTNDGRDISWRDVSSERVKEWTAALQKQTGIDLRDELCKNLSGEFTAAVDIPLGARGVVASSVTGMAFFIALKDPAAARTLFEKHGSKLWESLDDSPAPRPDGTPTPKPADPGEMALNTGFIDSLPRETYRDVDFWVMGGPLMGISFCWLDGYLVLADTPEAIKRIIDARGGAPSMAIEEKYRRAMSRLPGSANAAIYLGPRYFFDLLDGFQQGWSGRSGSQVLPTLSPSIPATVAAEIENDGSVLRLSALSPVGIIGLIATSMAGDHVRGRTASNEGQALYCMRQIVEAERAYAAAHNGIYGSLDDLAAAKATPFDFKKLGNGEVYRYRVKVKPGQRAYEATATPADYGPRARLSFYADASGRIRRADKNGADATPNDEMVPMAQEQ